MNTVIIASLFAAVTQTHHLPQGLLKAECWVESGHKEGAYNSDDGESGSTGICQIQYATARMFDTTYGPINLKDPKVNIEIAGTYLEHLLNRYNGNVPKAVAAYNAGKVRYNSKGLIMNRKYVEKVLRVWMRQ